MIPSSVARRYARALLSLGLEEGRPEQYGDELEQVLETIRANRELRILLENPGYSLPDRQGAIDALARASRAQTIDPSKRQALHLEPLYVPHW